MISRNLEGHATFVLRSDPARMASKAVSFVFKSSPERYESRWASQNSSEARVAKRFRMRVDNVALCY